MTRRVNFSKFLQIGFAVTCIGLSPVSANSKEGAAQNSATATAVIKRGIVITFPKDGTTGSHEGIFTKQADRKITCPKEEINQKKPCQEKLIQFE